MMSKDAGLTTSLTGKQPAAQLLETTSGLEHDSITGFTLCDGVATVCSRNGPEEQEPPPCASYLRLSCDDDDDRSD